MQTAPTQQGPGNVFVIDDIMAVVLLVLVSSYQSVGEEAGAGQLASRGGGTCCYHSGAWGKWGGVAEENGEEVADSGRWATDSAQIPVIIDSRL